MDLVLEYRLLSQVSGQAVFSASGQTGRWGRTGVIGFEMGDFLELNQAEI